MNYLRASLSIILIVYSIPTFLSGLDIYRAREPDLPSKWKIVCILFVLSVLLFLVSLLDLRKRIPG